MIKKLWVKNFKCFQEEQEFDFGRITLLLGANSSGKSSVMYAALGAMQSEKFPFDLKLFGPMIDLGEFRSLVHGQKPDGEFAIELTIGGSMPITLRGSFKDASRQNQAYALSSASVETPATSSVFPNRNPMGGDSIVTAIDNEELKSPQINNLDFHLRRFLRRLETLPGIDFSIPILIPMEKLKEYASGYVDANARPEDEQAKFVVADYLTTCCHVASRSVAFIGPFREKLGRHFRMTGSSEVALVSSTGQGFLEQIATWNKTNPKTLDKLNQTLKRIGIADEIDISPTHGRDDLRPVVRHGGSKMDFNLADVGAGVAQFLPIMVADFQLPIDSQLFVAEPEIHLHPSMQANFADYLVEQVSQTEKSYVVETHSEYLLNRIRLHVVKGTMDASDIQAYYLENSTSGTTVHRISFGKDGQIHGAPPSFFTTYEMDVMEIAIHAMEE